MTELILIEIISFASLIYSLIAMFYTRISINSMILIFLWTVIVTTFYAVNKKESLIYRASILLLLLPLLYFKETGAIYFIVITSVIMFLYGKTTVLKGGHNDYVSRLKRSIVLFVVAIYIRSIVGDISGVVGYEEPVLGVSNSLGFAAPFIIIYILTSIMLVRMIRHIEFNDDIKGIRKLNLKYLVGLGIVIITTGVEEVRSFIVVGFGKIVDGILTGISYAMYWLTKWIHFEEADELLEVEMDLIGEMEESSQGAIEIAEEAFGKSQVINFDILRKIIGFILIGILIYLVYKLLMKSNSRVDDSLNYTEEREYMEKTKKKKRSIFQNLRYPRNIGDQIRYHYRKYLKKLDKADIQVLSSDTTLEINQKAKEDFGEEIEEIREIYINSRYGNKKADENSVEKMKNLYKKL